MLLVLTLRVCWTDGRYRHISNWLVMAVAITVIVINGFSHPPWSSLGLLTLATGVLYAAGIMAGGDAKLILAYFCGISSSLWLDVFVVMAMLGGLLAFISLAYGGLHRDLAGVRRRGIPYGIAIGLSGMLGVIASTVTV